MGKVQQKTNSGTNVVVDGVPALGRLNKIDTEMHIIGALLGNFEYSQEAHDLTLDHFSSVNTRLAYEQIMLLHRDGIQPDLLTVADRLQPLWLGEPTCQDFLLSCLTGDYNIIFLENYVALLEDSYMRREVIRVASEAIATVMQDTDPQVTAGRLEQSVLGLTKGGKTKNTTHISDGLLSAFDAILEAYESPREIIGIPTGLTDLDAITKGWKPAELVVIGARPSMGKTAIATHIMSYAMKSGKGVLSINMEMPGQQSMFRFLADQAGVSVNDMRTGKITATQLENIRNAVGSLSTASLRYSNEASQTIHTITSMARRLHAQGKLDLLVLDYLQLVETEGEGNNSYAEVGKISRALKTLANDLNIPIVVLAQLNRALEARADKRPILSDLRDSGKIEADADMVAFLYRDEVYKPDTERPNIMEVIVAKNRNGNVGTADLFWHGRTMSVRNLQRQTIDL